MHTARSDERSAMSRRPRAGAPLVDRLAEDLDGAFEEVVAVHQDALFAFATGLCGDPGRAEEVVQDAFVRAHRALRTYPEERIRSLSLRPWLFRITLNALRTSLRGRHLRLVLVDEPPEVADPTPGPEAAALRQADRARLLRALACIPEGQRTAVLLRHTHDLDYRRIAEIQGSPVGTVKANVHRGLQALRRRLAMEET
jgi:RNA polymerase sigma-70 factor, ECF subfamily